MFCGIVDHVGTITAICRKADNLSLAISSQFEALCLGESIAVDGVCLTVMNCDGNTFHCEVSSATLDVTTVASYQLGQRVNLERAMQIGSRIGGHWVTGHVDGQVVVSHRHQQGGFIQLSFEFVQQMTAYLMAKGCITINGVSLTVNDVSDNGFTVMIIPHTLQRTNLADLLVSQQANVEWDYMMKVALQARHANSR